MKAENLPDVVSVLPFNCFWCCHREFTVTQLLRHSCCIWYTDYTDYSVVLYAVLRRDSDFSCQHLHNYYSFLQVTYIT